MIKNVQDLEIDQSSRVLLRCDLNLPQDDEGKFTDLFRLNSSLPTISLLLEGGATVIIIAHLGSPKGQADPSLSLKPISELLSAKLNMPVEFIENPFSKDTDLKSKKGLILIENLRFWPGEEESSIKFAEDLVSSTNANIFVQDAFGACHREHASLIQLPKLLPSCAGLLLQKEIRFLSNLDSKNLSLIVGGAKVESKLPVIKNFINKADFILTGGVVANTFLKSSSTHIGDSLFSEEKLEDASAILEEVNSSSTKLIMPTDYVIASSPDSTKLTRASQNNFSGGGMILDLGSETIQNYQVKLANSKTIVWAGTLGFAEKPLFAEASKQVLASILRLKSSVPDLKIIIGGGDTVDFVNSTLDDNEISQIDHLSTGGGASLLMLAGEKLPGIEALKTSQIEKKPRAILSLVANLKSNFNLDDMNDWLSKFFESKLVNLSGLEIFIASPGIYIEEVSNHISKINDSSNINVIAQDISADNEGSHTGEVAASMLKGLASGTLIGHSERRFSLGEDLDDVKLKVKRALEEDLSLILCVGGQSRDSNTQSKEVSEQLESALVSVDKSKDTLIKIAYEPVFAIGSGDVPTDEYLKDQLDLIIQKLKSLGLNCSILYGGSVKPENAKQIIELGFDGLLVGSASLKVESLEAIGINMLA